MSREWKTKKQYSEVTLHSYETFLYAFHFMLPQSRVILTVHQWLVCALVFQSISVHKHSNTPEIAINVRK